MDAWLPATRGAGHATKLSHYHFQRKKRLGRVSDFQLLRSWNFPEYDTLFLGLKKQGQLPFLG